MNRTLSTETIKKVGETIKLNGWVNARRNMGKIVFLDVRDRWGIVQVVCVPNELLLLFSRQSLAVVLFWSHQRVLWLDVVMERSNALVYINQMSMASSYPLRKLMAAQ